MSAGENLLQNQVFVCKATIIMQSCRVHAKTALNEAASGIAHYEGILQVCILQLISMNLHLHLCI